MRKLSIEKMKERIANGYYITYYYQQDPKEWELSKDKKNGGYSGGVIITEERAKEWLEAGAELLEM